jgi:hypothetical protein
VGGEEGGEGEGEAGGGGSEGEWLVMCDDSEDEGDRNADLWNLDATLLRAVPGGCRIPLPRALW